MGRKRAIAADVQSDATIKKTAKRTVRVCWLPVAKRFAARERSCGSRSSNSDCSRAETTTKKQYEKKYFDRLVPKCISRTYDIRNQINSEKTTATISQIPVKTNSKVRLWIKKAGDGDAVVCGAALSSVPLWFESTVENQILNDSLDGKLVPICQPC